MGRVFTFEELSHYRVPTESTFEVARQVFSSEVKHAVQAGDVRGAMIFGSAAIKRTSTRSDLDCFIVLTDDKEQNWDAAVDIVRSTREATEDLIPIGAIARPASHLETGRHEMDRFFGAHLSGPYRLVIGEDPANVLKYRESPALEILENFMISKSRKLSEYGWLDDPEERLRTLQRTLELPNAVGRKALRVIDEIEGTQRGIENSADKSLVGNASVRLFSELGTDEHATALLELDARYTDAVTKVLSGTMSEREYLAMLEEIAEKVIPSIGWLIRTYEAFEARVHQTNIDTTTMN